VSSSAVLAAPQEGATADYASPELLCVLRLFRKASGILLQVVFDADLNARARSATQRNKPEQVCFRSRTNLTFFCARTWCSYHRASPPLHARMSCVCTMLTQSPAAAEAPALLPAVDLVNLPRATHSLPSAALLQQRCPRCHLFMRCRRRTPACRPQCSLVLQRQLSLTEASARPPASPQCMEARACAAAAVVQRVRMGSSDGQATDRQVRCQHDIFPSMLRVLVPPDART
jgi:hypothetical protein